MIRRPPRSTRPDHLFPNPPLFRSQVAQPAAKPLQSTPILANPDAVFTYGGFIKFDALVTDTSDGPIAEGSAGRLFYVPGTIPVTANGAEPDSDPYTGSEEHTSELQSLMRTSYSVFRSKNKNHY